MSAAGDMKKGNFGTSLQQLSYENTPVVVSKKERDVSFWVQDGGYVRCGRISEL
jgi:hypothetical protein